MRLESKEELIDANVVSRCVSNSDFGRPGLALGDHSRREEEEAPSMSAKEGIADTVLVVCAHSVSTKRSYWHKLIS